MSSRIEWFVDRATDRTPDHLAIIDVDSGRQWTYAALRAEMDRRAAMLIAHGLAPGSVVLVNLPTHDHLLLTWLACGRADLTFLSLTPKLAPDEITDFARRTQARLILTPDGQPHPSLPLCPALPLELPGVAPRTAYQEAMRRSHEGSSEAITSLATTSGTTGGRSKIVRQPHRLYTWLPDSLRRWPEREIVLYTPRPNVIPRRQFVVLLSLSGTIVISTTVDPAQMEAEMAAYRVTLAGLLPPALQMLVRQQTAPRSLPRLQRILSGASILTPMLLADLQARYPGVIVEQEYGSTEGSAMMSANYPGTPPGSVGTPFPGVRVRIVGDDDQNLPHGEIGQVLIHTPGLMAGYIDDPVAEARAVRDGWLYTSDLGYCDVDGNYFLVGRQSLRINVGGFKVAPEEVEAVLASHPGVHEVVVLSYDDPVQGEVVRAVIVPSGEPPPVSDLRHYCMTRLATYKVPRIWEFRDALPHSPLGKVLRSRL